MSAELTSAPTPSRHVSRWWLLRDAGVVLGGFAVAGVLCGVLWEWWWTPATGSVVDHVWYPDLDGVRREFPATGEYVLVAAGAGLVLGALSAWLFDRFELVTLLAATAGSVLAAWLMLQTGTALAPPDPQVAAASAADRTQLSGTLEVSGKSPYAAFPIGALGGVAAVFIGLTPNRRSRP